MHSISSNSSGLKPQQSVAAIRDQVRHVGFADVPASFLENGTHPDEWTRLQRLIREQAPDPNLDHGANYKRSFGVFIVAGDQIVPVARHLLPGTDTELSGFNIGKDNLENAGARFFKATAPAIMAQELFAKMVRLSIELDPLDPIVKRAPYAVQVFIQGAEVDENKPELQAAPPDLIHNDACRFKLNIGLARYNVEGGVSHFLPAAYSGKPFDDDAKPAVLKSILLQQAGQGYCFLDNPPVPGETRVANAHYAERVHLGPDDTFGYRYVATITPTPLLPFMGSVRAVDAARKVLRSNTSSLFDMPDVIAHRGADYWTWLSDRLNG